MKKVFALALLFAGLVAPAFAQAIPNGKWWRKPELVRKLAITREQQDKFENIYRDSADQLIDLRAEVEKKNVDLRGALDRDQINRQDIQKLAARLSDARAKLFERELMLFVDMRTVLTADQWENFRGMLQAQEEGGRGMGRRGGPGGMGGMPPPGGRNPDMPMQPPPRKP
jgi:Spy/CpxP family protein refolding chaperone